MITSIALAEYRKGLIYIKKKIENHLMLLTDLMLISEFDLLGMDTVEVDLLYIGTVELTLPLHNS